jgi:hypothetical protein
MKLTAQIANHIREVHFGDNWTSSNLKEHLADVTWQQAISPVYSCNTIAALIYHMNYYVAAALRVLQGEPLNASDKYNFDLPPIRSREDWEALLNKTWTDAEAFASLVEQLPEERLWEDFYEKKQGIYYRNIHGIIEHIHYHLGQIVILKKILSAQTKQ